MRPFEVGDRVIIKDERNHIHQNYKYSSAIVKRVDKHRIMTRALFSEYYFMRDSGRSSECKDSDKYKIVTIRKPRHGSKEARDIVAMLRWEYRKEVRAYIFLGCGYKRPNDNIAIKAAYKRWERSSQYFLYQKAKSMLKVQS